MSALVLHKRRVAIEYNVIYAAFRFYSVLYLAT